MQSSLALLPPQTSPGAQTLSVLSAVLVRAHPHSVIFQCALLKLPVGLLFKRGDQPTNHTG